MKAFADNKFNVTQYMKFVFPREEDIVEKKKNASFQLVFLFPQCFQKAISQKVTESPDCKQNCSKHPLQVLKPFPHNDTF